MMLTEIHKSRILTLEAVCLTTCRLFSFQKRKGLTMKALIAAFALMVATGAQAQTCFTKSAVMSVIQNAGESLQAIMPAGEMVFFLYANHTTTTWTVLASPTDGRDIACVSARGNSFKQVFNDDSGEPT